MTRLTLRQVVEADRWLLWEWRNSERVRVVSTNDAEIQRDEHDAWYSARLPEMRNRTVIVQWDGHPVGWFQVEGWDPSTRTGEWGVGLGVVPGTPGLGGALPVLALGHAVDRLGAARLTGRVLGVNPNMLAVMRRLGVPIVEVVDGPARLDGTATETSIYRVTAADWPGIRDRGLALLPSALAGEVRSALDSPVEG